MKQKRQLVILAALLLVALGIWWWYLRDDKPAVIAGIDTTAQNDQKLNIDNPKLRTDEIVKARKTEYKGSGRNPFSPAPAPPPVLPQPKGKKPDVPQPAVPFVPPPPVVAPLPAKFFGFGTVPNGTIRLAFFNNGEDVFVVREGELLQNRFRILKINNVNLDYEDTTTGLRGTAPLEEQNAPGSPST